MPVKGSSPTVPAVVNMATKARNLLPRRREPYNLPIMQLLTDLDFQGLRPAQCCGGMQIRLPCFFLSKVSLSFFPLLPLVAPLCRCHSPHGKFRMHAIGVGVRAHTGLSAWHAGFCTHDASTSRFRVTARSASFNPLHTYQDPSLFVLLALQRFFAFSSFSISPSSSPQLPTLRIFLQILLTTNLSAFP